MKSHTEAALAVHNPAVHGPMAAMLVAGRTGLGRDEGWKLAVDCLRATNGRPDRARDAFLRTLQEDRAGRILITLMGAAAAGAAALDFIRSVDADMRGVGLVTSPTGQLRSAAEAAPRRPPVGETLARTPAASAAVGVEARAAPAPLPDPRRRDIALATRNGVAQSVLDTFLVDGIPVGDLTMGELRRIGRKAGVLHHFAAAIDAHVRAADDTLVRAVIKSEWAAGALRQAREAADVFNAP